MIDRGEQCGCVPLTSSLPPPPPSDYCLLLISRICLDFLKKAIPKIWYFSMGIKLWLKVWFFFLKEQPALHVCSNTCGWAVHWSYSRWDVLIGNIYMLVVKEEEASHFGFLSPHIFPARPHLHTTKSPAEFTSVPQTHWRCINSLIVHLTFLTVY